MQQMPEPVESRLLAQEALCLFYIISSILIYQHRNDCTAQNTTRTFVHAELLEIGLWTSNNAHRFLYSTASACDLTMQGKIAMVAPIYPEPA